MHQRRFGAAVLSLLVLAIPGIRAVAAADKTAEPKAESKFVRVTRDQRQKPLALEVAITRFAAKDGAQGPVVDLIGAVHIAEKGYFAQLNREFRGYDVVLYELVAPEGTRIPKGGRKAQGGENPLSMVQKGMKDLLELEFQLEHIDYTRKNLVHADMSPEQFARSMKERGDLSAMLMRLIGYAMAKQGAGSSNLSDVQVLMALFDKNRAIALKRIMAEQFQDMEAMTAAMEGPKGSTMIAERNKTALEVLRKQIAAGKRKIAIFYGAGHMPDFQKRLESDFGLNPVSTRWLAAWDLQGPAGKKTSRDPRPK